MGSYGISWLLSYQCAWKLARGAKVLRMPALDTLDYRDYHSLEDKGLMLSLEKVVPSLKGRLLLHQRTGLMSNESAPGPEVMKLSTREGHCILYFCHFYLCSIFAQIMSMRKLHAVFRSD